MTTNDDLMARARATFPGGVNSPVRAYESVGGTPRMLVRGHGAWVVDADGNELLDLVGGWGPALLGHAHPAVVRAVTDAASRGLGFGAPSPVETVLAEHIRDRVPPAERVRLVSTGTEATMTAVRLARGATGRDLIVKFAGHYHGHSDGLLAAAGSGPTTLGLPDSAGVPHPVASLTIVLPYHDLDALQQAFAAHGDRIAAIITEAAPANMGVIRPEPGLNAALAAIAHAHGALLISDEVLTGFRASRAGWWGVERAAGNGATPDLLTFGKVIGGGLPVAAVAGRADILDLLAPQGPVYQAGTLSGNPVAVAAGVATLEAADDDAYRRCDAATTEAIAAVTTALTAASVPHHIARAGTLFSVAFGLDRAPQNYDAVRRQEAWRYPPFFHAMLAHGVSLPPSVFEAWFVSAAHDERALDRLVTALPHAARAAAATPPPT